MLLKSRTLGERWDWEPKDWEFESKNYVIEGKRLNKLSQGTCVAESKQEKKNLHTDLNTNQIRHHFSFLLFIYLFLTEMVELY